MNFRGGEEGRPYQGGTSWVRRKGALTPKPLERPGSLISERKPLRGGWRKGDKEAGGGGGVVIKKPFRGPTETRKKVRKRSL